VASTKIASNLFEPYGKFIAIAGSKAYWAESNNGSAVVKAAPLTGGTVETVVSSVAAVAPGWEPSGAIALVDNRLYLGEDTFYKSQVARILAVDLSSGKASVFVSTADANTQLGHLASEGSSLYWTERRYSVFRIMSKATVGGSATTLCNDDARDLVARGSYLYYKCTDTGNNLRRVPLAGGSSSALYATGSSDVSGLDVDSTHAYWLLGTNLYRVVVAGGTAESVATCPSASGDLVVDGKLVYYSCGDSIYRYQVQ
jgi:hypothetical protein